MYQSCKTEDEVNRVENPESLPIDNTLNIFDHVTNPTGKPINLVGGSSEISDYLLKNGYINNTRSSKAINNLSEIKKEVKSGTIIINSDIFKSQTIKEIEELINLQLNKNTIVILKINSNNVAYGHKNLQELGYISKNDLPGNVEGVIIKKVNDNLENHIITTLFGKKYNIREVILQSEFQTIQMHNKNLESKIFKNNLKEGLITSETQGIESKGISTNVRRAQKDFTNMNPQLIEDYFYSSYENANKSITYYGENRGGAFFTPQDGDKYRVVRASNSRKTVIGTTAVFTEIDKSGKLLCLKRAGDYEVNVISGKSKTFGYDVGGELKFGPAQSVFKDAAVGGSYGYSQSTATSLGGSFQEPVRREYGEGVEELIVYSVDAGFIGNMGYDIEYKDDEGCTLSDKFKVRIKFDGTAGKSSGFFGTKAGENYNTVVHLVQYGKLLPTKYM